MIFKRISILKFAIRRISDLDLWRLSSVFFRVIRQQGLMTALKKTWRMLFWDQGVNYLDQAQQWYEQNECSVVTDPAEKLFSLPNILIVGSLDLPQCKKYRVLQKIELLEKIGFNCEVSGFYDIPRVFNNMQLATLVLFYRVPDDDLFRLYLKEAERLKIRTGYDIDDPIFAPDVYAENKNLDMLTKTEKNHLLESATQYRSAMNQCGFVTVSTPGMYELVDSFFERPIYLWRNVLDGETLSIVAEHEQATGNVAKSDHIVITYMSGSRAHDADFATIEHVLSRILADYPNVQLMICGYATVSDVLLPFKDRIKQLPFSGYSGYFKNLAQADICVVPLLLDRFNDCKSAIRFLEAAVLGIPTVASRIGDFRNLIVPGENGFLAESPDEWETALRKLIMNKDLRSKLSESSRRFVMEKQTVDTLSQSMQAELSEILWSPV